MKDITLLKQALPYMRQHKGSTFVVKLGGELAAEKSSLSSLAGDISLLVHVGIRVTIVHGGGPQATAMSKRLGLDTKVVGGRRVTDEATLDVAKMVFAGQVNVDILSALRSEGVAAVGLSGVDGDLLQAKRRLPVSVTDEETGEQSVVDFGHVGDVTGANTALLSLLMDNGYVPVVSSLGSDADGNILNINADTVASILARSLSAAKLLLLTNVPGLLADKDDPSSLIAALTLAEAMAAQDDGTVRGGMKPKMAALIAAVEGGVDRGHILSGVDPGSLLLELFTERGCGTLVARKDEVARDRAVAGVTS
ncbi:MAG: acetylglutamate kinase [Pseudohongiellaceae bacterium]|jgi:acetylglutamate kinase